jgi:hypothetical protein
MLIHNLVATGSLSYNGVNISYVTGSQSSLDGLNQFSSSVNLTTGSLNSTTGSLNTATGSLFTASGSFSTRVSSIEGNYATTGSNIFTGAQTVCANITSTGTIIAQTLNVQQVTSSIVYSSGSNIFGCLPSDVQQMTGSLRVTGSGNHWIVGGSVGINTTSPDPFGRGDALNVGISATGASDNMALSLNAGASGGRGSQLYMGQGGCRHFTLSSNSSETTIGTVTNTPFRINTCDTTRLYVSSSTGNVGIGATDPVKTLDVRGTLAISNNASSYWYMDRDDSDGRFKILTDSNCEAFTITTTRNVGIGVTPSSILHIKGASGSTKFTLQPPSGQPNIIEFLTNAGAVDARIKNESTQLQFETGTSGTPKMVITSGGCVGIGTISPDTLLTLDTQIANFSTGILASLYASKGTAEGTYLQIRGTRHSTQSVRRIEFQSCDGSSNAANIVLNPNGGCVGIGTFTPNALLTLQSCDSCFIFSILGNGGNSRLNVGTESANVYMRSQNSVQLRFGVDSTNILALLSTGVACFGGTVCAPCFATISDYRMKSNLRPIEGLSIIMNTKPYKFDYNYDCSTSFGMIAHELQDVVPEAVFGHKDGDVMQGVDYMKLLPIAIKAIQEQQCKINILESCLGIN